MQYLLEDLGRVDNDIECVQWGEEKGRFREAPLLISKTVAHDTLPEWLLVVPFKLWKYVCNANA